MNFFNKEQVNTKRQFELDLAKAICIIGMVFVHCFEEMPISGTVSSGSAYYAFVVVLDAIFGAGTFMICMGVGISYTSKNTPEHFIKRGLIIFGLSYLLNIIRFAIPSCIYYLWGEDVTWLVVGGFFYTDIMQFAGLAFLLYGFLRKLKVGDLGMIIIALAMSIAGSFVKFIDVGPYYLNELVGLFVGTADNGFYDYYAPFPLLNWFIFVVFGMLLGKFLKQCKNLEKYYLISTIISGVVVITYMAIAIPNKLGLLCGDERYYFQMNTYQTLIIICGALFAFGIYHYISKLFNDKFKAFVTRLSSNINKTYCAHWVIIGWVSTILYIFGEDYMSTLSIFIMGLVIYVLSSFIGELLQRRKEKKVAQNGAIS